MWVSDSTRCARRHRRAPDFAGVFLAGTLLIALTACGSQRASTRSGVAAPVSGSSAQPSSPLVPSALVSSDSPTRYYGASAMPEMAAVLEWIRTGSSATGTIELSGHPESITVVGPGTYPLRISFVGDSFTGSLEVSGRPVPISGQLTAAGVDLTFTASPAMNPTLSFTSIGPGSYSYSPSYPTG